jgi:alpha-galactosidase
MRKPALLVTFVVSLAVSLAAAVAARAADADQTVKVFILAGQSNMEGKASNELLDHQAADPKTKDLFAHLRDGDKWVVRDDVFIKFLDRKGPLTIGYGSPGRTGSELEFGYMMGEHFDEPVLLIKAAWGGHSLYQLFRSPSAGLPGEERLQAELEEAQKRVKANNEKNNKNDPLPTMEDIKSPYGSSYRNMLAEVKDVFDNCGTLFPELAGKQLEIAGFVWFQGFNDQWGDAPGEYESNMKHFIRDVRQDLNVPNLPFVIAAIGTNGSKPAQGGGLAVQNAQMAMNDVPEFQGNVRAFRTDLLVDKEAERLIDGWQNHFEEWKQVGSDRPYHYLGSAIWYTRIGHAMGESMLELMDAGGAQK